MSNKKEIDYLTQQLNEPFSIDFNKINSLRVKEYIEPLERKDSLGNLMVDYYYVKVFSSRKYSFSKSVFSKNKKYCIMVVSADDLGVQMEAYKNENNNWVFFKYISMPKN